jgi:hypothetical protein
VNTRTSIVTLALGLALASPAFASDVGYIYGRVETVDGDVFQGELRWGKEESFWDDIFNADKRENEHLAEVDGAVLARIRREQNDGWDLLWGDHVFSHMFAARFGDLKRIEVRRGDELVVEFRNGEELELKGGSNDVGAKVTVVDPKLGQQTLEWDRIRTIEFRETPAKLERKLGEPIYGTVKAGKFDFTGRIQWDNDECLTIDKLDGDTEDGDESIPFGDIASIRKYRHGALVTLKSGSELYLHGSNDVNSENRGVVVVVPGIGSVKIGWSDFDEVTFSRAPQSGEGYAEFAAGRDLAGMVVTRNARHSGRIVFDLDESRDFELLQGTNGDTEYLIPFRDIARIRPLGGRRAEVELRVGLTIVLEDGQDVTRRNDGLLVFAGAGKPQYIAWGDVTEIVFR